MDSSGEFALKVETMFYILLQQNDDNIVYDCLKLSWFTNISSGQLTASIFPADRALVAFGNSLENPNI